MLIWKIVLKLWKLLIKYIHSFVEVMHLFNNIWSLIYFVNVQMCIIGNFIIETYFICFIENYKYILHTF